MAGRTDLEQLVYQMSTDIRQLERQNTRALANVNGTAGKIESRYKALGKMDVGKFMDQTLDRSRLAVFEAGAARVPIFGAALSALGPAGMTAAAGVAALAGATMLALGAMKFADEIDDTSTRLNIGAEALQEYRFALTEVGGEAKDADSAIEGFQKKLGEGIAGGRAVKWFERLGFSREDLKAFDNTEQALDAVLDRISRLGRESERAAVADKLGLGPMVALAREGADRLSDLRQEARDLGIVMDAELVKRGAEANQQFETLAKVIDMELKSAIIDLGPAIVEVMRFVAWLAKGLADVADAWRSIDERSRRSLQEEDQRHAALQGRMLNRRGVRDPSDLNPMARRQFEQSNRRRAEIAAELARRPPSGPTTLQTGGVELAEPSGGGARRSRGPSGPSAEELARRRQELEQTLAIEIARLEGNVALVAVLEREREIERRTRDYVALKLSDTEARTQALRDQVQLDAARASQQDRELHSMETQHGLEVERLLGNDRFVAITERRLALAKMIEELEAKDVDHATATNIAKSNMLELDRARALVQARIVADAAAEHQLTLARIRGDEQAIHNLERADAIRRAARRIEADRGLNLGEGISDATRLVDEEIAAASTRGFRDGVRGMLEELKSGGLEGMLQGIFERASERALDNLADIIGDIMQQLAQSRGGGAGGGSGWMSQVASFLMSSFGRREKGGPVSRGRGYIVGEKRPEVFVPGVAGTILPSLAAAAGGAMSARGSVHQTFLVNAQGSVLAGTLVSELKAVGAQQAAAAASEAYGRARADIPADLALSKRYSR